MTIPRSSRPVKDIALSRRQRSGSNPARGTTTQLSPQDAKDAYAKYHYHGWKLREVAFYFGISISTAQRIKNRQWTGNPPGGKRLYPKGSRRVTARAGYYYVTPDGTQIPATHRRTT